MKNETDWQIYISTKIRQRKLNKVRVLNAILFPLNT